LHLLAPELHVQADHVLPVLVARSVQAEVRVGLVQLVLAERVPVSVAAHLVRVALRVPVTSQLVRAVVRVPVAVAELAAVPPVPSVRAAARAVRPASLSARNAKSTNRDRHRA
jgi:hypothetical protein